MIDSDSKEVAVKLADGAILKGKIRLRSNTRLSDRVNAGSDPFVVLFDIVDQDKFGKVLFVNKDHIVWVSPSEDSAQ